MKFRFVIKGDIEANSFEDAKDWIEENLTNSDCPMNYYFESIFEDKEIFEKCSIITKNGRQCLNHKLMGDFCGIHVKLRNSSQ